MNAQSISKAKWLACVKNNKLLDLVIYTGHNGALSNNIRFYGTVILLHTKLKHDKMNNVTDAHEFDTHRLQQYALGLNFYVLHAIQENGVHKGIHTFASDFYQFVTNLQHSSELRRCFHLNVFIQGVQTSHCEESEQSEMKGS